MIRKVLLIDDEPDIRKMVQLSLRAIGKWEVALATSGAEGLEVAAREQPDVILLDVMMPGLDGPDTLKALRAAAATAQIPVIFLTAMVRPEERAAYEALGAAGAIAKPFDAMSLPGEVTRIFEALVSP